MDTRNEVEGTPAANPAGATPAQAPQTPPAAPAGAPAQPTAEERPELLQPEPESADGAQPATLRELASRPVGAGPGNIDMLMDVNVSLTVELGAVELELREILALGPNSVVKLARNVDEPVDILVNHELVARGEEVVVDDEFGVRITELVKSAKGRAGDASS